MVQEYCGTGNNNAAIKKQPVNLNMLMQKNGQNRKKKKSSQEHYGDICI